MARSYVVKIETNLKGGAVAQPGPRTIILGKSRAGKSTRVNAVEAAGSGRVSDVAGRATLARDADLMMLAPNNADRVFASVKLSDGQVCEWSLERGHRAKRSGPEIAFPLRDVREAILGEPDKARKWILQHGGDLEWKEVEALVPVSLHTRLASLTVGWDAAACGAAAALAGAISAAKDRVRSASATAKSARAQTSAGLGTPPTDSEMKAAEEAARFADPIVADAVNRLGDVRRFLIDLKRQIAEVTNEDGVISRALAALPRLPPVPDLARSALTVAEAFVAAQSSTCGICGSAIDRAALATRVGNARKKLDETLKTKAEEDRLVTKLNAIRAALATARRDLATFEAEEARILKVTGPGPWKVGVGAAAGATLADLQRRRAGWALVRQAEENALQAEREGAEWAQLADALSAALGTLVERARGTFEAKVQAFLPPGWRFGVDLLDGEREVLRVGLREEVPPPDGRNEAFALRAALSGVEWATVTAALALATAPADGPVVIAPEERAFDPETLSEVMEAFGRTGDAQVILTSPVAPSRVPAGWTVITVGESKPTVIAAVEPQSPQQAAALPVVKRGPGRPRKNPKPDETPAAAPAAPVATSPTSTKPVRSYEEAPKEKSFTDGAIEVFEFKEGKAIEVNGVAASPKAPAPEEPFFDLFNG